jgi:hypothetical protein
VTRDQAEKGADLLKKIQRYEALKAGVHSDFKKASDGDKQALENLATVALELSESMIQETENKLSKL